MITFKNDWYSKFVSNYYLFKQSKILNDMKESIIWKKFKNYYE